MKLNPAVQVIIGEKLLSAAVFERYIQADDVEAQRILDAAPLTQEAQHRRARQEQIAGVEAIVDKQMAREAKIGARNMAAAYAAQQPQDGPHGAILGGVIGTAMGQMSRGEPGKMFSRETVCAIIRAQKTTPQHEEALSALNRLQSIFENLE